jgi:hypothetical protein
MATPTLDFGSFSSAQKTQMLAAAQAAYLQAMTGRVQNGSAAAQSYGFNLMTVAELINLINGLTIELGLTDVQDMVRPNFSHSPPPNSDEDWQPWPGLCP